MSNIVNVAWMYPDILNLHGERGNAKAFELVSKKMGVKLNIDRIDDIDSNINYENYDILLFNAGELKHIEKVKERLENDFGLKVVVMENTLKGIKYLDEHPEARAKDLMDAFKDDSIKAVFNAIGGDDTYRLLPFLFEHNELADAVSDKVFLGFSDTTINHFMLHKVGMKTFYGQSFLADVCELDKDMLPYTKKYFEELISTGMIKEVIPSEIWYEGRTDFGINRVGTPLKYHSDYGFELLQGNSVFSGEILGGCIDSIYDFFNGKRYVDMPLFCKKYKLFPEIADWVRKILLLESSEEKMSPEKYRKAVLALKETGIFDVISGILIGKPMDETYVQEYKQILVDVIDHPNLPIVCNINIGHAQPRCIIPFGVVATVDIDNQVIRFAN